MKAIDKKHKQKNIRENKKRYIHRLSRSKMYKLTKEAKQEEKTHSKLVELK